MYGLDDGNGTIDEDEFVVYCTERGDAMMLGLVMGATAHSDESAAKNVEIAQREATDALVMSLRAKVVKLTTRIEQQTESMAKNNEDLFNVVSAACFGELNGLGTVAQTGISSIREENEEKDDGF